MAKRFTDTDIWEEDWFLELGNEGKLFWFYLKDSCDHAGFWRVNRKRFEFIVGKKFKLEEFLEAANSDRERIEVYGDRWYISSFIKFQYGSILNPSNRVHESIIRQLKTYVSDSRRLEVILTSFRPQIEVKEGVKDKDKDKDREYKEGGVGETIPSPPKPKKSISERRVEFKNTLAPFLEQYGRDMLNEFFAYWTEPNKSQTAFRYEGEKFWDLPKRLATWHKNQKSKPSEYSGETPASPTSPMQMGKNVKFIPKQSQ